MIFKILADTAAEFKAFKHGEVVGDLPAAASSRGRRRSRAASRAPTRFYTADTGNVEALWMNNAKCPFDSEAVRQAIAYSIDRDAIVKQPLRRPRREQGGQTLNPPIADEVRGPRRRGRTTCSTCSKVNSLMTGDGWAKGSDGIWAKGGKKAAFDDQEHGRQQAP